MEGYPVILGNYEILKPLAEGGFGQVYLARMGGAAGFSRTVAIKRIRPEYTSSPSFVSDFIKEARIGGYLTHHNVVQVLGFEEIQGQYFLIMEYVDGVGLDYVIRFTRKRGETLPLSVVAEIVAQAAEGLHYVHTLKDANGASLRLVHRDLKPSNLMISRIGLVKVTDFGVARSAIEVGMKTQAGLIKGTLAYLSPEQARDEELDSRSDLYSLGAILYELLTLRRLFPNESVFTTLEALGHNEVQEPLEKIPDEARVFLPLLEGLLTERPEDRIATGSEVARQAREIQLGLTTAKVSLVPFAERWIEARQAERTLRRLGKKGSGEGGEAGSLEDVLSSGGGSPQLPASPDGERGGAHPPERGDAGQKTVRLDDLVAGAGKVEGDTGTGGGGRRPKAPPGDREDRRDEAVKGDPAAGSGGRSDVDRPGAGRVGTETSERRRFGWQHGLLAAGVLAVVLVALFWVRYRSADTVTAERTGSVELETRPGSERISPSPVAGPKPTHVPVESRADTKSGAPEVATPGGTEPGEVASRVESKRGGGKETGEAEPRRKVPRRGGSTAGATRSVQKSSAEAGEQGSAGVPKGAGEDTKSTETVASAAVPGKEAEVQEKPASSGMEAGSGEPAGSSGGADHGAGTAGPAPEATQGKAAPPAKDAGTGGTTRGVVRPPGRLTVTSRPSALVYLNGESVGETPIRARETPAGRHTLRLSRPDLGFQQETKVTIESGKDVRVICLDTGCDVYYP